MTTPAQAAAQRLTGSKAFAGPRSTGTRVWVYGALPLIAAVPVFLAVLLVTRPGGWAVALVSTALGVALWAVWGRLFPSNVLGTAAADADGTVRVLTARRWSPRTARCTTRACGDGGSRVSSWGRRW